MRKVIAAAVLAMVSVAAEADGPSIQVPQGFNDGNHYEQLSEPQRTLYLMGVIDGLLGSPLMGKTSLPRALNMRRCVSNSHMTAGQITVIVDVFMANKTERWGEDMGSLVLGAMLQACAKEGTPLD